MTTTPKAKHKRPKAIVLTTHTGGHGPKPAPIVWGAEDPLVRGPLIGTVTNKTQRNVIGTHAGSYSVYRAVAVAAGALDPLRKPDLTNTAPTHAIGPFPQWFDPIKIVSLDPWGALVSDVFKPFFEKGYDIRPTIAITRAHIQMHELADAVDAGRLKVDGKILKPGGSVVVVKAALEPVWYLPGVAARFGCSESDLRRTLFEHTAGMFPELVTRNDLEVFLPPIGGATVYMFGDVSSIPDAKKPLAVRVHDECNGSDVFGSDICTCRPYLTHGIEEAVRMAQAGGSGVIVYNRKEGRALGEVTKFLVYNARKRQEGGDTAAQYFARTECVAGVQDMRFQELMPDTLHWLGISKIDRFVSMSNMKHDAVVRAGIQIVERVAIPDELIPQDARVEMDAKMAAGYFTEGAVPDGNELAKPKVAGSMADLTVGAADEYDYLQTTAAIRARAAAIFEAAERGELEYFRLNEAKLPAVAERVIDVTRRAYPDIRAIPYHGRYRHFDAGGVPRLARFQHGLSSLSDDDQLRARTELVVTSVLLDAGAGATWQYREPDGRSYARSEGLAVASYHLFMSGALASDHSSAADGAGLARFDAPHLESAFQVTPNNPLTGVAGRTDLLRQLGEVVQSTPRYFDSPRPRLGDLGVFLKRSARDARLPATAILSAVLAALGPIWPGREKLAGQSLGDVWKHSRFGFVPFHKLSQWLSYSLFEPLEASGLVIEGMGELTGLPEYRNGGLFLDAGVLELTEPRAAELEHEVWSDLVIEWRALTVVLLDRLADAVRAKLGLSAEELPLARVLEGGSWSAGRAIARELRPDGGPPLRIISDGTVF